MNEKTATDNLTGGCMCGAIRYETHGETTGALNCHCESCRRHTGAPMATLAVYMVNQVRFSGDERGIYESTPGVGRGFCAKCGTSLTWEAESLRGVGAVCALHISTFDDPEAPALKAVGHTFYGERISWFDVVDDLPRYEGFRADKSLLHYGPASKVGSDG